jgi:preprotein translocase SecF subunit
LDLSKGVFPLAGTVGSVMAKSLQQNAVIAIILSWICMVIYIAIRFELKYGIAAVVALVHDVLIALGATVAWNWFAPDTWGISIDINFASVAAFMTIVGYSVNDTIVVFDRVRENLKEMKGQTFDAIINASVNQTLSRTIITSLTVFFSVVILFVVTARSGGGIASFTFPMIIGTIAGSYSTIFIASPVVKMLSGKK